MGRWVIHRPYSPRLFFTSPTVTSTVCRDTWVPSHASDHLVVSDRATVVPEQDTQRRERLRAQPNFYAVARDAGVGEVDGEGSEGDLGHNVGTDARLNGLPCSTFDD